MELKQLSQQEIEALTPEQYAMYLAYGDPYVSSLTEEEMDCYVKSHKELDL